jgi:hypothetical protein
VLRLRPAWAISVLFLCIARGQETNNIAFVHVDAAPGHAINTFDPDKALGSSIDVLSRDGIEKVFTPHIIQELLSPAGGRLLTETTPNYGWRRGTGPKTAFGATRSTSRILYREQ